jgi:hypothetical protein
MTAAARLSPKHRAEICGWLQGRLPPRLARDHNAAISPALRRNNIGQNHCRAPVSRMKLTPIVAAGQCKQPTSPRPGFP